MDFCTNWSLALFWYTPLFKKISESINEKSFLKRRDKTRQFYRLGKFEKIQ